MATGPRPRRHGSPPSRIVLTCWGSYGDLFPYIAVALALKARGHSPVVATCPFYRDIVQAEGLEFRAVGPDVDPSDTVLMARVMDPARGSEVVIKELVVPHVRSAYTELFEATEGADVLVTHPITFAGPLVAAVRRLRWISSVLAPASLFSLHDFPVLPPYTRLARFVTGRPWSARLFFGLARRLTASWTAPVRAFRAELGLPPAPDPLYDGQYSPSGTLALFSTVMATRQPDWPAGTVVTGFPFYNRPAAIPAAVARFLDAGTPPVVFTLGSSAVGAPGSFYDESVSAAAAIGQRALLMVRSDVQRGVPPSLPESVLAVDYAPHEAIFPRALAVVHHGGVGTTGQALRSGRPMLVVPHAHDQYDNGARVARLGVARVLDAAKYRAPEVARHLRALVSGPGYRRRAEEVAGTVGAEPGAEEACDAIERVFARGGRPAPPEA